MSTNRGRGGGRTAKRRYKNRRGVAKHATTQTWGMTPTKERPQRQSAGITTYQHDLNCPRLYSRGSCTCEPNAPP